MTDAAPLPPALQPQVVGIEYPTQGEGSAFVRRKAAEAICTFNLEARQNEVSAYARAKLQEKNPFGPQYRRRLSDLDVRIAEMETERQAFSRRREQAKPFEVVTTNLAHTTLPWWERLGFGIASAMGLAAVGGEIVAAATHLASSGLVSSLSTPSQAVAVVAPVIAGGCIGLKTTYHAISSNARRHVYRLALSTIGLGGFCAWAMQFSTVFNLKALEPAPISSGSLVVDAGISSISATVLLFGQLVSSSSLGASTWLTVVERLNKAQEVKYQPRADFSGHDHLETEYNDRITTLHRERTALVDRLTALEGATSLFEAELRSEFDDAIREYLSIAHGAVKAAEGKRIPPATASMPPSLGAAILIVG